MSILVNVKSKTVQMKNFYKKRHNVGTFIPAQQLRIKM